METFRRIPRFMDEKRNQKAKDVKSAWLTKKYFFGNDSPASREGQDLVSVNYRSFMMIHDRGTLNTKKNVSILFKRISIHHA